MTRTLSLMVHLVSLMQARSFMTWLARAAVLAPLVLPACTAVLAEVAR